MVTCSLSYCKHGGKLIAAHSDVSFHHSLPGHPALFANAMSILDVELGHYASGLSWPDSFLPEVQHSACSVSYRKEFWTSVGLNVAST